MTINTNKNPERVAECTRVIGEISTFSDQLNDWERTFVADLDSRITKYGESTYITDRQFDKLSEIYHRIC